MPPTLFGMAVDVPMRAANSRVKRGLDLVVSAFLLLIFSPAMVLVAFLVKLFGGPGPIIYRGPRIGYLGQPFSILKFRTMRIGSDQESKLTAAKDPRSTRIGDLLRATKLDELPQLVNVLRGEMSLVGPRPGSPEHVAKYHAEQRLVLLVRPGITGAAALEYRNEPKVLAAIDADKRERFYMERLLPQKIDIDLEYLLNWTIWRDLGLMFRTAASVFLGLGLGNEKQSPEASGHSGFRLPRSTVPLTFIDACTWVAGVAFALVLRHGQLFGTDGEHVRRGTLFVVCAQLLFGTAIGNYRGRFALGRFTEAGAVIAVQILVVVSNYLAFAAGWLVLGRLTVVVAAYWALLPMLGARYLVRYWLTRRVHPPSPDSQRVLVYGAGLAAQQIVPDLVFNPRSRYRPVGLVEDARDRRFRTIAGVTVVGTSADLPEIAQRYRVDTIVLALAASEIDQLERMTAAAHIAGLAVVILRMPSEVAAIPNLPAISAPVSAAS
jgi:lipopolysaccharide/colanic/teichoic acid biosynthesis glycosyltransferase